MRLSLDGPFGGSETRNSPSNGSFIARRHEPIEVLATREWVDSPDASATDD